jgi:tellurite resistance protein
MHLFDVQPARAPLLLGAMRAVALADGAETPRERALLEAVRDALGLREPIEDFAPLSEIEGDLDALTATEREHVLQTMLLMAVIDGSAAPEEAALIARVAGILGVEEPRVHNLEQLARGRVERMKFDLTRKGYAKTELVATAKEEGLLGLYRTFGPLAGLGKSHDVAQKYIDLGRLPEGTLGRAYFRFIYDNGLDFPGEGAIGERGVWHDMIHVMGGYPVDPRGEAEVVAFMAGFRQEDPFFWVFTSVLQFQVGLRISPFAPGVPDQVEPRRYLAHHRRGSLVRCDLSRDWDFRADLEADLEGLRRRFNVVPLDHPDVGLTPGGPTP